MISACQSACKQNVTLTRRAQGIGRRTRNSGKGALPCQLTYGELYRAAKEFVENDIPVVAYIHIEK